MMLLVRVCDEKQDCGLFHPSCSRQKARTFCNQGATLVFVCCNCPLDWQKSGRRLRTYLTQKTPVQPPALSRWWNGQRLLVHSYSASQDEPKNQCPGEMRPSQPSESPKLSTSQHHYTAYVIHWILHWRVVCHGLAGSGSPPNGRPFLTGCCCSPVQGFNDIELPFAPQHCHRSPGP